MTLGGLAAAVGLVIDDAIVVVENIVLHRDSGQSRAEAIRSALREIRVPLVGSTVTPIVVFLPLVTMTGVREHLLPRAGGDGGDGAADFAGAGADLDADAEPLSCCAARREGRVATDQRVTAVGHVASFIGLMGRVTRGYGSAMRFVLAHPLVLAAGCVALVAASFFCYHALGSDLLPEMDEGGFILDYLMPAGSSLRIPTACCWAWRRFWQRRRKWRARRGAPDCNWAWRR